MVIRRLEAKSISAGLGMELAEVQGILQAESDEHDLLRAAVRWSSMTWGWHSRRKPAHLRLMPQVSQRGWASLRRTPFTPGSPKPLLLPALIMIAKLT